MIFWLPWSCILYNSSSTQEQNYQEVQAKSSWPFTLIWVSLVVSWATHNVVWWWQGIASWRSVPGPQVTGIVLLSPARRTPWQSRISKGWVNESLLLCMQSSRTTFKCTMRLDSTTISLQRCCRQMTESILICSFRIKKPPRTFLNTKMLLPTELL